MMTLALTLTFAGWWIPLLVTFAAFAYFFYVASQPNYGWFGNFDAALAFIIFIVVSLIAWLIYFIIV